MQNLTEIGIFLNDYLVIRQTAEAKKTYSLNIIDELHANENAHTRILLKLLEYRQKNNMPVLRKFIDMLNLILETRQAKQIKLEDSKVMISGQYEFIDGYIKSTDSDNSWAIIIENKINWAGDQESQIDRYVETARKDGIAPENIYVVYLTDNGAKKVSEYSFSKAKEILEYKDNKNSGRFIELNYRDNILPFLKEVLTELKDSKENVLKTALYQYIDYLEGRFFMRETDKEYYRFMNEELIKKLDLNGLTDKEKFEKIETIQQEIYNQLDQLKYEVYPNEPKHIAVQLKELLKDEPYFAKGPFDGVYIDLQGSKTDFDNNLVFKAGIQLYENETFFFRLILSDSKNNWCNKETFSGFLNEHKEICEFKDSNKMIEEIGGQGLCSYSLKEKFSDVKNLEERIKVLFDELLKSIKKE